MTSLTPTENGFRALWARPQYPGFLLTVSLSRIVATMFNTAGVLLILLAHGKRAPGRCDRRRRRRPGGADRPGPRGVAGHGAETTGADRL